MSPLLDVDDPGARHQAAAALAQGRLVVVPTDTVYGIAARLDRPGALAAIFAAKARPPGMALPVLVATIGQARVLALLDERAEVLAAALWPGPLTLVVPRREALGADLGGDRISIGIRVPHHAALRLLLAETGPLATTSANRSGMPTPPAVPGIQDVFGDAVAVYLDGGTAAGGPPSTVVALTGPTPALLREGGVPFPRIQQLLEG